MRRAWWILALLALAGATAAPAQEPAAEEQPPPDQGAAAGDWHGLHFGLEAKAHLRDSESSRFPVTFPPFVTLPNPDLGFERTVDPGTHMELSVFTLFVDADWGPTLAAHAKIDFVDLHDRNPTSEDKTVDVDEAWLRFGRASEPAVLPEHSGAYVKVGKMAHFERQNDRHLESYGVVSTAFNRFEDFGVELGVDLGRHLYLKASATSGNPVFFRDPNALAGDNGTSEFLQPNPQPRLGSGILILYDAEVEDIDTGHPELGAGLGLRFADAAGENGVDLLVWGYRRTLADTVHLNGTFYGGDLDLLRGPFDAASLAISGDRKRDVGANLWLYLGGFSLFGQYVDQDLAGLGRTGIEGEVAWRFDLPVKWGLAGRQLFPSIAPAFRYSNLDTDFRPVRGFPAPSVAWPWEKLDYGLRLGIVPGIDLTVEYADNTFTLVSGRKASNDEFLTTLRWRM
jgi:hypothetical protein